MPQLNTIEKHYWKLLPLCALIVFLFAGGYNAVERQVAAWRALHAVKAAGMLPSFELRRTERLNSARHANRETFAITMARRADGAEVTITENRSDPAKTIIERTLFLKSSGLRIDLDDHIRAKSTFHYALDDPRFLFAQIMKRDITSSCANGLDGRPIAKSTGSDLIVNVPAVSFIAKGIDSVRTSWIAPSLGCVTVRERFEWGERGKPGWSAGDSTPGYIRLGEPQDLLFTIPTDYREVKPSERHRENVAFLGSAAQSEQQRLSTERYLVQVDAAYARGK